MVAFEALSDSKERVLKKKKWIKEQIKRYEANKKVIDTLISVLPNDILC